MKSHELFDIIGKLADDIVIGATRNDRKRLKKSSVFIAAACICVLLAGTAATASYFGISLKEILFSSKISEDYSESGFDLEFEAKKFGQDSFSPDLLALGSVIIKQYEETPLWSSSSPWVADKKFGSIEKAKEFVGLSEIEEGFFDFAQDSSVTVSADGDKDGKLNRITIESYFADDKVRCQLYAYIYTENHVGELTYFARTTEDIEFESKYIMSESGKSCLVISSSPLDSGNLMKDMFVEKDGIIYALHLAYPKSAEQEADRIINDFAKIF